MKDMFRRNAREEHYFQKDVEKDEKQRKEDLKIIEKCRFNKESIPEELRKKYAEELGEYVENPEKKKEEYEKM